MLNFSLVDKLLSISSQKRPLLPEGPCDTSRNITLMTLTTLGTLIILTRFVGCDQRFEDAVADFEAATLVAKRYEVKRINLISRIVVITLEFPIFISPD